MSTESPKSPEERVACVEEGLARAEELRKARSYNEGIRLLVDVLQYGLEKAKIYYRLGNLYVDAGDLARAEYAYKRALEVDPKHTNAMHNLAVVYKRQKKVSLFVKTYKQAQRMALRRPHSPPLAPSDKVRLRRLGLRIILGVVAGGLLFLVVLLIVLR